MPKPKPCPHPGLRVQDRCYWCCKVAALNGHRDRLTDEALGFVGVVRDRRDPVRADHAWLPTTVHTYIDNQLAEIARLRDIAPGWYELARRIVE
jgi:hypothetical protein